MGGVGWGRGVGRCYGVKGERGSRRGGGEWSGDGGRGGVGVRRSGEGMVGSVG